VVTLTAGTAILNMPILYKPDLMPMTVTMVANFANAISSTTTIQVSEPSKLAIFALGLICLASLRLKRQS
jgi:hypothetical protein